MRILRFSHDYLLNVGGLMVNLRGLNRELARCGVEIDHAFLIGEKDMPTLVQRGRLRKVGDSYVQQDAMVNLFPCIVPNRSPTVPDGDSPAALEIFERDFRNILDIRKPDIVHVHLVKHAAQYRALELAAERGIRTVMSHHEGYPESEVADDFIQRAAALVDLRLSITKYASLAIRSRPVDYIGFYVDTVFWNPTRVLTSEIDSWRDILTSKGRSDILFVYPARFIKRKNHLVIIEAARLLKARLQEEDSNITFKVILVGETIARHEEYKQDLVNLVSNYSLDTDVLFMDVLEREQLRSLLAITDVVIYPSFNEGAGRSHLEGMLMGNCAIVSDDAGLMEYIVPGENGLAFSPHSASSLMDNMLWTIHNPGSLSELVRAGRETASRLTLNSHALDHIRLYESLLSVDKRRPATVTDISDMHTRTVPDLWSQEEAVLVIDLDYCLIRPTPIDSDIPSAFPLQIDSTINIESEGGREYQVRSGIGDLEQILRQPWHARIVVSMSAQAKVTEVCNKLRIGGKPLAGWLDACIGKEALKLFARINGICLPLYSDQGVHNPLGRTVRTKPTQIALVRNLSQLGVLIRNNQLNADNAESLMTQHQRDRKILWIDDQVGFSDHSNSALICHVVPFIPIEEFASLVPVRTNYSVAHFNIMDFIWRASNRPFGYLLHLLRRTDITWKELSMMINVEMEILKSLPGAENDRQFGWLTTRTWGGRHYQTYQRTIDESTYDLFKLRLMEHLDLYKTLLHQVIVRDLHDGKNVLLLGRDMDYAFQVACHYLPDAVSEGRLACLPISRQCIADSAPDTIVSLLHRSFPSLLGPPLSVYDVGYHGRIVSGLSLALGQDPRTNRLVVSGRLLNKCSCTGGFGNQCSGSVIEFQTALGNYSADRALGISIERMPHRTGTVNHIAPSLNGFRYGFDDHPNAESRMAERLADALELFLSEGEDIEPNSIGILDKVARCAAKDLQRRDRSLVSQMRRLISGRANHTHTGRPHLSLVNPPSLGDIDLLALLDVVSVTPHIVCLDSSSLRWSDKQNDPTNSPIRLSRLISRLCSDALDRYSGRQEHRIVKSTDPLPDVDLIALVSLMPCMGYLGLCGPNRVVDFTSTASPHDVSLAWIVESGETATSTHFNLQNVTAIAPEVLKAAVSTFWPTTHADRDQREQEALVTTGSNVEGTWLV